MNFEEKELLVKNLDIKLTKLFEERMNLFEQLFSFYNNHTNLISKKDAENLFEKHIYDSLALSLFFRKYELSDNIKLMDFGTGGGFPSIPLGIAYPDMRIYPVDSIAKKIGFIELVQKELRLENLNPLCSRVENLNPSEKSSFDVVTCRAVAPLNALLEYAIPYLKVNGYFVAFKSVNTQEEINMSQNALSVLNAEVIDIINYKLPNLEDYTRDFIVIQKKQKTPSIYPRKSGQVRKNPL